MTQREKLKGIFNVMSANDTLAKAKNTKDSRPLWKEFWYEDEVCCLFADANVGKSILAVQIAEHIASNVLSNDEKVFYYDFELSPKQFEKRYTDKNGKSFKFNERFMRVELNSDAVKDYCQENNASFDEVISDAIEANITEHNSKVIIVDNISWLLNMKATGNTAGKLMMKLCSLKKKYGLSILVLAHTPKRNLGSAITQNTLSGSKTLTNFFDSMFAIGMSQTMSGMKYVKQIKVRQGAFKYGEDHVQVCKISKNGAFLGFETVCFTTEEEQLKGGSKSVSDAVKTPLKVKKHCKRRKASGRRALVEKQLSSIDRMVEEEMKKLTEINA